MRKEAHMEESYTQWKIHIEVTYTLEGMYITRGRTHGGTVRSIQYR